MKKVAVIIVTYNRQPLLAECIDALAKLKFERQSTNLDLFVIDNASTDNTQDYVQNLRLPNLKYYNTGKNLGGAGGFNYGLKVIRELDYDYYWLMDDDTIVHPDSLQPFLEKAAEIKDDFSFMNSVVLWTDNTLCKMNIPSVTANGIANFNSLKHNLLQIDSCSFVSCFINAKHAQKAGLPITDFFIYGDDVEYTLRLSKYAPGFLNPYSVVTHKMKNNAGADIINEKSDRLDRYFYNFRNLYYILHKYNQREFRNFCLKRYYLTFKILFKSKDAKLKRIHILNKGFRAGKKFHPKVERF